ncbi:hypothetical protein V6N11_002291 [Hibiscus sabdariffa]|uniref:Uncharacterized protein n=1 Tax=Hibiscus sabdariffa TaxID=183260 RepID=A0ABR1ZTN1_9ROSI
MALVNEDAQKQGMYRNEEREQRSLRVSELIIKTIDSHNVDDCCDVSKDPPSEPYLSSFNPIPTDTSNFQLMAPNYGKKCNYGKAKAIMDEDMGDQIYDIEEENVNDSSCNWQPAFAPSEGMTERDNSYAMTDDPHKDHLQDL